MSENNDIIMPELKLSGDQMTQLQQAKAKMPEVKKAIKALKKAGVDMREIESKVDWADGIIKVLEEDFA